MNCRHCGSPLSFPIVDLGSAPPSNAYLTEETLHLPEKWYPLRVLVCEACWLVQTEDFAAREELFNADYAYFSSVSTSWLEHCERYVDDVVRRFDLGRASHVVEIGANDGYLLQYVKKHGVPCTGVEPTAGPAASAREKGIPIVESFFGTELAQQMRAGGRGADLVIVNNVLAHVPDINDFVAGIGELLNERGVAVFEFPHLLGMIEGNQFDTIYHEHYSYLSLTAVRRIFQAQGLTLFDVEEQPTHGGSLRVFARLGHEPDVPAPVSRILAEEDMAGLTTRDYYGAFQQRVEQLKNDVLRFLLDAKREGKRVAAYGAAAKGNTLLNFAGIRSDLLPFVADRNLEKQGKFLPGSRIPIVTESRLKEFRPEYVIVFPWNIRTEITEQLGYVREWGGRFVTAIPETRIS